MRISQKLEYACRAMTQLARHHAAQQLIHLDTLAQREEISANFLVQILNDLRRAGLIESRRGAAGGYLLARQPERISLQQIIEAVDPSLIQCQITREGESGNAVRNTWDNISNTLCQQLSQITLDTIASNGQDSMFYI